MKVSRPWWSLQSLKKNEIPRQNPAFNVLYRSINVFLQAIDLLLPFADYHESVAIFTKQGKTSKKKKVSPFQYSFGKHPEIRVDRLIPSR